MIEELILRCLGLVYQIGVNDGLREAVGRKKEQEGEGVAVALALDLLAKGGVRLTVVEEVDQ